MGLSLCIRDLVWAFEVKQKPFLRIPSLDIAAGETIALCGPSGSGKSSLLYLLAGMEKTLSGDIQWGNQHLGGLQESERDAWRRASIGLVFQDFQLVPELTVLENVLLASSFRAWAPSQDLKKNADRLIERVGLTKPRQLARTLSRGEMQRTALARALLFSPSVILADEPTASLDETNEELVTELLFSTCCEEGATLIVATHQKRLMDRAHRIIRLEHGQMVTNN